MASDILFRFIVYLASVWVSVKFADGYWVVGPVFGMAVISYDSKSFRNLVIGKHALFLLASTLIYSLVYWISIRKWGWPSESLDYFAGPFPAAVVTGSILLPFAHRAIFGASAGRTLQTTLWLSFSFFLVTLTTFINDRFSFGLHVNFIAIAIALWQGIYLYFLSLPAPKK